jgi:large subunit ribosomal protein L6
MSRLSKKPIILPEKVKFHCDSNNYIISGNLGSVNLPIFPMIDLSVNDNNLSLKNLSTNKSHPNLGLLYSLINNAIEGVSQGHKKVLELKGLGYRCNLENNVLILSLGFSHKVNYNVPNDIKLSVEKDTIITISGIDKQRVGQVAAEIRAFKVPDNYHAKGILYQGEIIITKEGKKK